MSDRLRFCTFEGIVWRHTAVEQAPLDMLLNASRGGRFNPPFSFPMLYTSLSASAANAELVKSASLVGTSPELLLPRMLHEIEVSLRMVVDLTDADNRGFLGCSFAALVGSDWTITQRIGVQLRNVCDAILSYSAADPRHKNLNLYIIDPSKVSVVNSTLIQSMADWKLP